MDNRNTTMTISILIVPSSHCSAGMHQAALEEYNKALSVLTKIKAKICIEQFFRGKKTSISTDTAMIQLMELRTLLQQCQYQSALSLLRKWQDFTMLALKI